MYSSHPPYLVTQDHLAVDTSYLNSLWESTLVSVAYCRLSFAFLSVFMGLFVSDLSRLDASSEIFYS